MGTVKERVTAESGAAPHEASPDTKRLEELLLSAGLIIPDRLKEAVEESRLTGQKLEQVLITKGWVKESQITELLASQVGVKTIDLDNLLVEAEVFNTIPQDIARTYKLIPVYKNGETLGVAMTNPTNVFLVDDLQRRTGLLIEPLLAPESQIDRAIAQYYGTASTIKEIIESIDERTLMQGDEKLGEEAPIIKLVNLIIVQAVQERASDIHIEPEEHFLGLRYRIDGVLHRRSSLPKTLQAAVLSRVKIMAGLAIAEKRVPQDGRIMMKIGNKAYDFRVSTNPVTYGENIVLRILDKSGLNVDLEKLGFDPLGLGRTKDLVAHNYGVILVTGPTGSGKSTTLYAILQKLNKDTVHIVTAEDPVEYELPLIRQTQVNPKAGLHFATALRAFLRQDPNIIMVGEIRDQETAQLAIQAALTGHLVLSTLHTNDSPTAIPRLLDMGVEPFLVSSSLLGVVAQRLMRKICDQCKEPYEPLKTILEGLGLGNLPPEQKLYRGKGCALCNQRGYKGRVGIYEVFKTSSQIQELILKRASADAIKKVAIDEGMKPLRQLAIEKLLAGVTTVEEVLRVTQET